MELMDGECGGGRSGEKPWHNGVITKGWRDNQGSGSKNEESEFKVEFVNGRRS